MSDYYANTGYAAYQIQQANDARVHDAWQVQLGQQQAEYDAVYESWQQAHDEWVANGGIDPDTSEPYPEPIEPFPLDPLPEPESTATPPTAYVARTIDAPEEITTATGPAFIAPGRVVLTPSDGSGEFALSEDELDAGYVLTTSVTL